MLIINAHKVKLEQTFPVPSAKRVTVFHVSLKLDMRQEPSSLTKIISIQHPMNHNVDVKGDILYKNDILFRDYRVI